MTTEERVDQLVRDADPGGLGMVGDLGGVKQALLEDILSESLVRRSVGMPPRRLWVRRFAGVMAAAAVLLSIVPASIVLRGQSEEGGASPIASADAGVVYSAAAMAVAQRNPRLLIDRVGWKVSGLSEFTADFGTITFRQGGRELEMTWYPESGYADRRTDRLDVGPPKSVRVDGWPADLFQYFAGDYAVLVSPRDGLFVEMRTSGNWSRKDLDRVLENIVRVDARTWLAALPAEMVRPPGERAVKVLAGVPLPPGFDVAAFEEIGLGDSFHFALDVTSRVGCAWIDRWQRATAGGDEEAARQAADALRGSHGWRVLRDMDQASDWPEVFWKYADEVAAGTSPTGYSQALGCR
ncbi:hypothetical protein [Micromonospora sp. NBC_00617]|uniref:hypothetical protein n=1 Tax=Micromonospora sp. NBC_00617 TaxID=2903587 RepID=UPI0030E0EF80